MKEIPLTQGMVAMVDDDIAEIVGQFKWQAVCRSGRWYGRCRVALGGGKVAYPYMHQCVLGHSLHGMMVDHVDGNGLNNQRYNLRMATPLQNSANRRSFTKGKKSRPGVHQASCNGRWIAQITISGKRHHLGSFDTEEEAYRRFSEEAAKVRGEFFTPHEKPDDELPVVKPTPKNSTNTYKHALTQQQCEEMRAIYFAGGRTMKSIGEQFGVSPNCARLAIRNVPTARPRKQA